MMRRWTGWMASFWPLQLLGWGAYGVVWFFASVATYEGLNAPLGVTTIRVLFYVGIGCAYTGLLRPLYRRLWTRRQHKAALFGVTIVCSLLGSLTWLLVFETIKWPLDQPAFQGASIMKFARTFVNNSFVFLAWSALYVGIKYQQSEQAQRERTLRAETLAREAQLQMLRYQLNPHFLFNTLNTLRALIGTDDDQAKGIVTELSDFLRYSLLDLDARRVPLRKEIAVTHTYLSIEKIRFEDRLHVAYDVDPNAESVPVPPFLVHSLVENAVKHGMATSPLPLRIRLTATRSADTLRIDVANTGCLSPPSADASADEAPDASSNGIGLTNVRRRLQQHYPGRHRLTLHATDGWVHATIEITVDAREHEPVPVSS